MTTPPRARPATLYAKLWDAHVVHQADGHPAVVYVDLHLVHDGTYRRAFEMLDQRGLAVAHPERTIATADHCLSTRSSFSGAAAAASNGIALQMVTGLVAACDKHGIRVFGPDHDDQGIVHVIGPELGLVHPGMTVVCADSHTTTLGALGTLAFAIGTTQILHALASQCVLQQRARAMHIVIDGALRPGVSTKDLILALLARHGIAAANGCAVEFSGSAVRGM
ncbi:MAG: aconitase family protein, partial [Casimicrobiaceae bacterium]